jgi:hypothetical protein
VASYPIGIMYFGLSQQSYVINTFFIVRTTLSVIIVSSIFGQIFYLLVDKPIRNIEKNVLFPAKIRDLKRLSQKLGAKETCLLL